eukprot:Clim_evm3s48 gene=Clim_evmTU3s48
MKRKPKPTDNQARYVYERLGLVDKRFTQMLEDFLSMKSKLGGPANHRPDPIWKSMNYHARALVVYSIAFNSMDGIETQDELEEVTAHLRKLNIGDLETSDQFRTLGEDDLSANTQGEEQFGYTDDDAMSYDSEYM